MSVVYLNGHYVSQDKAVISVMDRGFLFGDGVYEVIPVYNGKLFRFENHIARLHRSLDAIELPLKPFNFLEILQELLIRNEAGQKHYSIYLQITRGPASIRHHAFPDPIAPTVFAMCQKLIPLPLDELKKGKAAITVPDTRWENCYIKSTSLLANVLLFQQAEKQHACEALLVRNGKVVEGATSNIFMVKDNTLFTPPLSQYILGGITRDLVIELAHKHQIPCHEKLILESDLANADEIWITSSTREIFPITQINQKPINQGIPGPLWHKMIHYYHEFIRKIGSDTSSNEAS